MIEFLLYIFIDAQTQKIASLMDEVSLLVYGKGTLLTVDCRFDALIKSSELST